jgi:hypothetical protein
MISHDLWSMISHDLFQGHDLSFPMYLYTHIVSHMMSSKYVKWIVNKILFIMDI